MSRTPPAVFGIALSLVAAVARADGFVNVYEIPHNVSMNVIGNQLTHEIVNRHIGHWDAHAAQQKAMAKARTASGAPAAAQVREPRPADRRAAEGVYRKIYEAHEQVIRTFGLPSGDLAVGMASCIAGAWMAFHNKPFPDRFFPALVRQMRQRVDAAAAAGQTLSPTERRTAYEGLAITGMYLASSQITWARDPGAAGADELKARMRSQGGETLERMLRVAPEAVGIGAEGVFAVAAR